MVGKDVRVLSFFSTALLGDHPVGQAVWVVLSDFSLDFPKKIWGVYDWLPNLSSTQTSKIECVTPFAIHFKIQLRWTSSHRVFSEQHVGKHSWTASIKSDRHESLFHTTGKWNKGHDGGGLYNIQHALDGWWDLSLVPVGGLSPGPQANESGDVGPSPAYLGISPMQSLSTQFMLGFIKMLSLRPFLSVPFLWSQSVMKGDDRIYWHGHSK